MKKSTFKTTYLFMILFVIIFLDMISLFFFPAFLIRFTKINILFLVLLILIGISPYGKIKNSVTSLFSMPIYIIATVMFQSMMILFFYTVYYPRHQEIFFKGFDFLSIIHQLSIQDGLFPWPIYIFMSIGMSYYVFHKNKPNLLSIGMPTLKNEKINTVFGHAIDILISTFTFFSVSLLTVSAIFQSFLMVEAFFHIEKLSGINAGTLLFSLILLNIIYAKRCQTLIQFLCQHRYSVGMCLLMLWAGLSALFCLFCAFFPWINHLLSLPAWQLPVFHVKNPMVSLFNKSWWLLWTPIAASVIAFLSQGYSLRSIIFINLLSVIFLISILPMLQFHYFIYFPWIGLLLVIVMLWRSQDSFYFIHGFIKPDAPRSINKSLRHIKFMPHLLQFIVLLFVTDLLFGTMAIAYIVSVGGVLMLLIACVYCAKLILCNCSRYLSKTSISPDARQDEAKN